MQILGLESLVFGVEDIDGCGAYLRDYGLVESASPGDGRRFEALDGTSVVLHHASDARLPPPPGPGCLLRRTVMAVADRATLGEIAAELGRDRAVKQLADGSIESVDDCGFALGFCVTRRRPLDLPGEISNAPGAAVQRPVNDLGITPATSAICPRTLSHVVYFVPDAARAEAFYANRLGFRCTDRFTGVGPFLQPGGTLDHHTHFLIQAPPHMTGVEHFTFHFGGPTEVMRNGTQFARKGYQAFWGPGRHIFGSNWFWYFNSPFACHVEMDADMDRVDQHWVARESPIGLDTSQAFLLRLRRNWFPGPGSPANGDYAQ